MGTELSHDSSFTLKQRLPDGARNPLDSIVVSDQQKGRIGLFGNAVGQDTVEVVLGIPL
jgi:hypothetical protein